MSDWIKCSDKLPSADGRVIVFCILPGDEQEARTSTRAEVYVDDPAGGRFNIPFGWKVTHWMPMPEPPQEGGAP